MESPHNLHSHKYPKGFCTVKPKARHHSRNIKYVVLYAYTICFLGKQRKKGGSVVYHTISTYIYTYIYTYILTISIK